MNYTAKDLENAAQYLDELAEDKRRYAPDLQLAARVLRSVATASADAVARDQGVVMDRFEFDATNKTYWFTKEGACECFFSDGSIHENLPSQSVPSIGIRALMSALATTKAELTALRAVANVAKGFDEWLVNEKKRPISDDMPTIEMDLRSAYLAGHAARQAEVDALRAELAAKTAECERCAEELNGFQQAAWHTKAVDDTLLDENRALRTERDTALAELATAREECERLRAEVTKWQINSGEMMDM